MSSSSSLSKLPVTVKELQFLQSSLEALSYRPKESITLNRGNLQTESFRFDIPENFIADKVQGIVAQLPRRNTEVLSINDVTKKEGLKFVKLLDSDETFSTYLPKHQRLATRLLYFLKEVTNPKQLIDYLVFLHDVCNPYLYNYVMSQVIINRHSELSFIMPDYFSMFPELFINGGSYNQALTTAFVEPTEVRSVIEIEDQFMETTGDPELLLNYFREDNSLNLFHVIYNRLYPCDGPVSYVTKPRRGEIFFHVYQQLVARYNFERLSNGLARVKRLNNFYEPIPEVCFPKLNSKTTKSNWPGRMANRLMKDLDRDCDDLVVDLSGLERWRDRLIDAIDKGHVILTDGTTRSIVNDTGIDDLGQAIQSAITSPNRKFYGNLHTMGLIFLGFINDPSNKHAEPFGVAADPTTVLRDSAAFRWFALIVDILQSFKVTLPKYLPAELGYPGLKITDLRIITQLSGNKTKQNELCTHYGFQNVELTRGLDYLPQETIRAKFRQLELRNFTYTIKVLNSATKKNGTVRIFLLPKFDERQSEFKFQEQRELAIELDKFTVSLNIGENTINRKSTDAQICKWFSQESVYYKRAMDRPRADNLKVFGWPENLLLPKGNTDGFPCQLFAMISNDTSTSFSDDAKPLGYPFDRPTEDSLHYLSDFCTDYGNMITIDTKITFENGGD